MISPKIFFGYIPFLLSCSSYVSMIQKNLDLPKDQYVVLYQPTKTNLLGYFSKEEQPESEGPLEKERPNPCFDLLIPKQTKVLSSVRGSDFAIENPLVEKAGFGIPDPNSPCYLEHGKPYSVVTEQIRVKELTWKGQEGPKETHFSDVIVAVRMNKMIPLFQEVDCDVSINRVGSTCLFPQERGSAHLVQADPENSEYVFMLRRQGMEKDQEFSTMNSDFPKMCQSGENRFHLDESCFYPLSSTSAVFITLVKDGSRLFLHTQLRASYFADP